MADDEVAPADGACRIEPVAADPWPLRHLVLRTPRLELRPVDDDGLFALAELARLGVHAPELMPFTTPWTDATPATHGP